MKVNSILFLLFVWVPSALAQPAGQLGALNTDAAVQQMVRSLDDYYKNFVVDSRLRFADKRVQQLYKREKVKAWEKADIDGNGLIDMLITGTHYDEKSKVICVLNMGDSLVLEDFGRQFYRYCPVARIVYQGVQPLIAYADYGRPFLITEPLEKDGRQEFLLSYRFGGLIEYNPAPTSARVDSLLYTSHFAYHEVEEISIRIGPQDSVIYKSCEYPVLDEAKKKCEDLATKLTSRAQQQVGELLNYLQPDKLNRTYRIGHNHVPYIVLHVVYADGRQVQVDDKGGIGSFGLTRLYTLLHSLRKTQSWIPTKK
ncbi:hypothetical protein FY528_17735 [Hymenobacter lutimineralis]|uniref:Uncharacterized protein n=1 Tax=Hymenobacter lutimineralis TaxID=2606448 RepID=A0A5D6UVV1_9BACT|nr:hypothetical protein [Hymenobacter lutimineralis]TYZ06529.1 hypothetical protein FY528_17735 [Hymenobacter lutimineralis]